MSDDYIKLADCVPGAVYTLQSRNLTLGVYDGKTGFIGLRHKLGHTYLFTEYHHDRCDSLATVRPLRQVGAVPAHVLLDPRLFNAYGTPYQAARGTQMVPVRRRDLTAAESPHGRRNGFVDEYADTGERLPEGVWLESIGENQPLRALLEAFPTDP